MSIRVQVENGVIVPLEPLPAEWDDGRELQLSDGGREPVDTAQNGTAAPGLTEESDERVEWLTDEEYERFQAALEQADREAKAWMRREMGLE